jgi:hypothetical protein
VVFEGSYATYKTCNSQQNILAFQKSSRLSRDATVCIVHAIPSSISNRDQDLFVKELRGLAGTLFVTGLSVDYYASFWGGLQGFVDDLDH